MLVSCKLFRRKRETIWLSRIMQNERLLRLSVWTQALALQSSQRTCSKLCCCSKNHIVIAICFFSNTFPETCRLEKTASLWRKMESCFHRWKTHIVGQFGLSSESWPFILIARGTPRVLPAEIDCLSAGMARVKWVSQTRTQIPHRSSWWHCGSMASLVVHHHP